MSAHSVWVLPNTSHPYSPLLPTPSGEKPILQTRRLRHREGKRHAKGHTASQWLSQDSNVFSLGPETRSLITISLCLLARIQLLRPKLCNLLWFLVESPHLSDTLQNGVGGLIALRAVRIAISLEKTQAPGWSSVKGAALLFPTGKIPTPRFLNIAKPGLPKSPGRSLTCLHTDPALSILTIIALIC